MFYVLPMIFLSLFSVRERQRIDKYIFLFLVLILTVFIGLRFEVGSDWTNYFIHTILEKEKTFAELSSKFKEPAYALFLWITNITNTGIFGLNVLNAIVFSIGLVFFCSNLKYPFLGILISYPYLVIVVGMNYVNQSAAIGVELIALTFYLKGNYKLYFAFLAACILFHASAVFLLTIPLVERVVNFRNKKAFISMIFILIFSYFVVSFFFLDFFQKTYTYYFTKNYNAGGFIVKGGILFSYALVFFMNQLKMPFTNIERSLLNTLSINVFGLIFLSFFTILSQSSAVIYRLSLYLYPVQIILSDRFVENKLFNIPRQSWRLFFVGFYFLTLIVWLGFSSHSSDWLPYKNFFFLGIKDKLTY
ncbi:EpsG family protein [Prochlorococcus marinus XMU1412]|uniref:EpsG family protein n=1 Tax=Prochlorococcus marinus TaxID=1219 RepID=UPI001ADD300D|nr:EpsG family protein [Prochlorococcus marinus]MBO8240521.1 EpsG family protein [Prochlorococcus marinus XMU1412]